MQKALSALFVCLPALAAPSLETWTKTIRSEYPDCRKFDQEVSKIIEEDSSSEAFTRKDIGMKALGKLGTVPVRTEANKNLFRAIFSSPQSVKASDVAYLWDAHPCTAELKYYSVLSRLLRGIDTLNFTPAERSIVVATTLRTTRSSLDTPNTLIGVLLQSALLQLLVDKKLVEMTEANAKRLSDITQELEAVRNEIRAHNQRDNVEYPTEDVKFSQLKAPLQERFAHDVKLEHGRIEPLRERLYSLAAELKPVSSANVKR